MPGLFDLLDSDDARLGIQLLAAGGYTPQRMSTGQRIAGALQGVQAQRDGDMRRQLLKSQIDENSSQARLREAQLAKQAQILGLTSNLLGDSGAVATNMGGGSNVAQEAEGAEQGGGASGLRGVPIERIAALKAAGGPDLIEAWKTVNVPTSLPAGGYAFTPGRAPTYMADPSKGLGIGRNGVFVLPGAAQAQADLARGTERAKSEEQARFQEASPTYNPDGTKSVRSRLDQYGGGNLQQTPSNYTVRGGVEAPYSMSGRTGEQIAVMQDELKRTDLSEGDRAGIQREIQRLGGAASSVANVVELSPAQQATNAAKKTLQDQIAKGAADTVTSSQAGAQSALGTLQNVDLMRKGLGSAIMGPGANARISLARVGQVLGVSGRDAAEQLANTRTLMQGLSRQELSAAGQMKGQGQITESERAILRKAEAGDIAELSGVELQTLIGILDRSARHRLDSHESLMARVNAGEDPGQLMTVKRPADTEQPKAPKLLPNLPTANASNKGQRIRDTTTGKILMSNGIQWKEQP